MCDDLYAYLNFCGSEVERSSLTREKKDKIKACHLSIKENLDRYFKNDHTNQKFYETEIYQVAEILDIRFAWNKRTSSDGYIRRTLTNFYDTNRIRKLVMPDPVPVNVNVRDDNNDNANGGIELSDDEEEPQSSQREVFQREINAYKKAIKGLYDTMLTPEKSIDEVKLNKFRNETNIRSWWFQSGKNFPLLSILACRVLEVPAQSAGAERIFSGLTAFITSVRASIDKVLAGLMVLNYMQSKRDRTRLNEDLSVTLPLPVFGLNFAPDVKSRVRLVIDEEDPHEDAPDDFDEPENDNREEVREQEEQQDEEVHDQVENEQEEVPEDEQEEIAGVIYPDDARQRRVRSAPLNYRQYHRRGERV